MNEANDVINVSLLKGFLNGPLMKKGGTLRWVLLHV